jgi:pimeloyl-ACP methyl ester carboxylesterase
MEHARAAGHSRVTGFGGAEIAFTRQGAGSPALVFVHGWSCDAGYWAGQTAAFSRKWPVVTLDLAGHGQSGLREGDWSMASFGADVAAVVEALVPAPDRLILIGHSMGGDVILEAARALESRADGRSDGRTAGHVARRIAGLVWVDAHSQLARFRSAEQVQRRMAPFREDFRAAAAGFVRGMFPPGADAALVERVVAAMSAAPPAIATAALESAMNYAREVPGVLQQLRVPVIAINPESTPEEIQSLGRHGVEVLSMSGAGHFMMLEDPERFNALLRIAITRLADRAAEG